MNTTTPNAVVIIPHYNDTVRLTRCLQSLMENDTSRVEIVVVDNNSTDALDDVKTQFPSVRFLTETNKGAALARNKGVRETDAPLLFFIDADCVADKNWLTRSFEVAPMADLIGGRVDVFDETPPPRNGAEAFEAVFAFDFKNYIEVQGFTGSGNMVTSRKVFEDVGDFINGVSEDRDWSMRAVAKGYKLIYIDDLIVSHPSRSDWPALRYKWWRVTKELCASNGQGIGARVKWAIRGFAMPLSALLHVPKILKSSKLNGAGEKLSAIGTLVRLRIQRMTWMLKQAAGFDIK